MKHLPTSRRPSPTPRRRPASWSALVCTALLTLTLGGCCFCGEAVEKLGDAGDGAASPAETSAARADDNASGDAPKTPPPPAEGLDALDADRIRATIEAKGWKLLGDPNPTKAPTHTATMLSVIKPPMGGVISLYVYTKEDFAERFVETMKPQDAALHRQGVKVLAVTIPGHRDQAHQLLDALVQKTP